MTWILLNKQLTVLLNPKKPPPVLDKDCYKRVLNEIRDITDKNVKYNILQKIGVLKVYGLL